MSRKRDFEEHLLQANKAPKRTKKGKRNRRITKRDNKNSEHLSVTDSSIDTTNDNIDVEEELCVEEMVASTSDQNNSSEQSFIEMSAADKLKSQSSNEQQPQPQQQQQLSLNNSNSSVVTASGGSGQQKSGKKRRNRRGSGTSSEEERWLDAIESGKLEQVDDELKKIKDPKLMTARQRAMYERSIDKEQPPTNNDMLFALPTGYKEKVMTAEAIEKAQLKSQKRKQLADEKREKDKRKTMDRLLKKQETKVTKLSKNKFTKIIVPMISYREHITNGATLSYPIDVECPMISQIKRSPPKNIFCAICKGNQKRYSCSKTNVPLCSFKCYKLNLKTI